jgi:hypothetical protein
MVEGPGDGMSWPQFYVLLCRIFYPRRACGADLQLGSGACDGKPVRSWATMELA